MKTIEPNTQSGQLYPTYDLNPGSIEVGEVVSKHGGAKAGVDRSQIAAGLNLPEDSSIFPVRIASARAFGIIAGKKEYLLTEAGRKYFEPQSASDRQVALLTFLATPLSFSKFIETYDGSKIATGQYLANIFLGLGVGKSWAARVSTIFTKAAELAGALDSQGYLRYKATMKNASLGATELPPEPNVPTGATQRLASQYMNALHSQATKTYEGANVWVFSAGGVWVKVETPQEISLDLWEKLNKYIQIIKPEDKKEDVSA